MLEANIGLVGAIAREYALDDGGLSAAAGGLSHEDRVQEGAVGLLRAAERFEPQRGLAFSTYARYWVRHCIGRAVATHAGPIRIPHALRQRLAKMRGAEAALR